MKKNQLKKVLFFAPILEYPTIGGPTISASNAVKVLSSVSNLHIISTSNISAKKREITYKFFSRICNNLYFINKPSLEIKNKFFRLVLRIIKKIFLPINSFNYSLKILFYIFRNNIKIIWIDRIIEKSFFVYLFLDLYRKLFKFKYKLIADTETVYSEFVLRELEFLKNNSLRYLIVKTNGTLCKLFETYMLKTADVITAVSSFDQKTYKERSPSSEIKLFSNTVDILNYQNFQNYSSKIIQPSILLLGSFGNKYSPMNRARQWLINQIMPIIWEENPRIHLYIIGRNAFYANDIKINSKVTILSNVNSTIPFLKNCSVLAIPLKHESGTRFKIVEAGAAKIPCVSTTLGAEGLNIENGKHILIADKEKKFAEDLLRVINDSKLKNFLTSNMYDLVKENYSLDVQKLEAISITKLI